MIKSIDPPFLLPFKHGVTFTGVFGTCPLSIPSRLLALAVQLPTEELLQPLGLESGEGEGRTWGRRLTLQPFSHGT